MAFGVGVFFLLSAVGVAGEISADALRLGLALVPPTLVGLFLGRRAAGLVDSRWLRPAVLGFAAFAGLFALVRGVW